jgi:hypothetical protein
MNRTEFFNILEHETDLSNIDVIYGIYYSSTEIKMGLQHLHFITRGTEKFKDDINDFLFSELCRGRYWHPEKPITPTIRTYWNNEIQKNHEYAVGSNVISYKNILQTENHLNMTSQYTIERLKTVQSIITSARTVLSQYITRRKE